MNISEAELKQKLLEHLILVILGTSKKEVSVLHIEKEIFLLCQFNKEINEFYKFVKHYRGPYLDLIKEVSINPSFLDKCWSYIKPKNNDSLSGGFIQITDKGYKKYNKFINDIINEKNEHLLHLINAIEILDKIYGPLNCEELLLLIYKEYPEFTENSNSYNKLENKKFKILKNLLNKNFIDEVKYNELLQ